MDFKHPKYFVLKNRLARAVAEKLTLFKVHNSILTAFAVHDHSIDTIDFLLAFVYKL